MCKLDHLFDNNRTWTTSITQQDPDFFNKLSKQQAPEYLWIGCSDSRVPANEIVGLLPGELFVHRNVANAVIHTDLNCQSVIQYAVEVLKVKHIIVCGHYGCGGVRAAMETKRLGLIDGWLSHIRDAYYNHQEVLQGISDENARWDKMCELNVMDQVFNISNSSTIQGAWDNGQNLTIHGWIYGIKDGLLKDLNLVIKEPNNAKTLYQDAISR